MQCRWRSGKPSHLETVFEDVFSRARSNHIEKLILDLRLNGGGDNTLILPIIHGIIRFDEINRRGRSFTIIGRRTQSAAQNLVNHLQKHTQSIFVGEPTGESPNHYGEPERFNLPNSQLEVQVSTLWWQDLDPRDTRAATEPDILAELTSEDYRENRDPALDAIFQYVERPNESTERRIE